MLDVEYYLTLNEQVVIKNQCVLCEVNGALDGVFDGYETEINLVLVDCVKHVGNGAKWNKFACGQVGLREQGLLGEGACRAEVADAPRCRCHINRLGVSGYGGRLIFSNGSPLA